MIALDPSQQDLSQQNPSDVDPRWFQQQILHWAKYYGRHHFPWQAPHTPYKTWISEIMLQQTQAQRVVSFFNKFIATFPDIETLAEAQEDEVFHLWSGLGYYTRAQNLLKPAQLLTQGAKFELPLDIDSLTRLPGIGRSTAGAIRSLGHGLDGTILDGNVRRVLGRFNMITGKPQSKRMEESYWNLATRVTPGKTEQDRYFNQGMMDLGATICTIRAPKCDHCPLKAQCSAYQNDAVEQYPITLAKYRKLQAQPTQAKRKEIRFYLLIQTGSMVLLEKRPPMGIWRNLWCPQEYMDYESLHLHTKELLGDKVEICPLPPLQHSFSHFDLELRPYIARIQKPTMKKTLLATREPHRYLWYNLEKPQSIGLASPVEKLLNRLTTPHRMEL